MARGDVTPAHARLAIRASIALLLASVYGCATVPPPLYYWGGYEDRIYASYLKPGEMPPERQIEGMEKDYQAARAANLRLPPGWHAQLAYLYAQSGRTDQARQELLTEKAEFPEATVFVDQLLTNLQRR